MTGVRRGPLVVVGDALLDRDLDGTAERLAPDAPAPVVDDPVDTPRPGGAALTALLAARDGQDVVLVAPFGDDPASREVRRLLAGQVEIAPVALDGPLTEKVRIRAHGQTLARIDRSGGSCGEPSAEAVAAIRGAGVLVVSDYGRGMTSQPRIRSLIAERARNAPLVWDPHPRGAPPVLGTLVATPNRREALLAASAARLPDEKHAERFPDDVIEGARVLLEDWHTAGVCVTLGARGALLAYDRDSPLIIPAPDLVARDTCGAGDSFAAALGSALRRGALLSEAVGEAVEESARFVAAGAASALAAWPSAESGADHDAFTDAEAAVRAARLRGGTLVATGGCFDVLHAGHLACLRAARALGDFLVVCLNSDASVRRLKGPSRPINTAQDRAALLSALDCVDAVVVFDQDDPGALLDRLRPDVWVKGGDYSGVELPESSLVHSWGGHVITVPYRAGHSSTAIIDATRAGRRDSAPLGSAPSTSP